MVDKAVFRDVRITVPASDNFVPYRDYIGSNLEVMDVVTGNRKILYQAPDSLQAAKLDQRWPGVDLQQQWPAVSFRSCKENSCSDRHGVCEKQQQRPRESEMLSIHKGGVSDDGRLRLQGRLVGHNKLQEL